MPNTSERPTDDTEAIVYTYGNTLYRLCLVMLGSAADAEDALQETFLRYFRSAPLFKNSDLNTRFNAAIILLSFSCLFVASFNGSIKPIDLIEAFSSAPTFEVIIMTVFLKFTRLPLESVSTPSSKT